MKPGCENELKIFEFECITQNVNTYRENRFNDNIDDCDDLKNIPFQSLLLSHILVPYSSILNKNINNRQMDILHNKSDFNDVNILNEIDNNLKIFEMIN